MEMRRFKNIAKRIYRRLFGCEHKYSAYLRLRDGNRFRTVWKCTRCGKEKIGK